MCCSAPSLAHPPPAPLPSLPPPLLPPRCHPSAPPKNTICPCPPKPHLPTPPSSLLTHVPLPLTLLTPQSHRKSVTDILSTPFTATLLDRSLAHPVPYQITLLPRPPPTKPPTHSPRLYMLSVAPPPPPFPVGFRERLLADPSFMVKLAIECGIGICTKCTAEYTKRQGTFSKVNRGFWGRGGGAEWED